VTDDNEWYDHSSDPVAEARWEQFSSLPPLPEPGTNAAFDKFLAAKNLTRESLVRLGARWDVLEGEPAITYLFPDGLKRRGIISGKKRSEAGVTWTRSKIVHSKLGPGVAETLVIAEGETDGAFLANLAGATCDVAILPAGAKHSVLPGDDFSAYERVLVALDADAAGNDGAATLLAATPKGQRLLPPSGLDWCESLVDRWTPEDWVVERPRKVWSVGSFVALDLGTVEDNNWFEHGIVPRQGMVAIHGPMKSLKSFVTLEFARSISTGTNFAGYVPYIAPNPGRVLVVQFEVSPFEFQRRLVSMLLDMPAAERELFKENAAVYGMGDKRRPRLKATDPHFTAAIKVAAEEAEADVVIFDPVQRMTGTGSLDKTHEIEPLLDAFAQLADDLTVIFAHHNNKASRNDASAYAMAGSQRFGADVDSILSMYHDDDLMIGDHNDAASKQRGMAWELRNGACGPRMITATPNSTNPDNVDIVFSALPVAKRDEPEPDAPTFKQPALI
jgi:hypothetical protein